MVGFKHQVICIIILANVISLSGKYLTCKITMLGKEYSGTLNQTPNGRTCQRWDSQSPHEHTRNNPRNFPDLTLADAANYCRNPDGEPRGPWCYTTDSAKRWEYCGIDFCQSTTVPMIKTIKQTSPIPTFNDITTMSATYSHESTIKTSTHKTTEAKTTDINTVSISKDMTTESKYTARSTETDIITVSISKDMTTESKCTARSKETIASYNGISTQSAESMEFTITSNKKTPTFQSAEMSEIIQWIENPLLEIKENCVERSQIITINRKTKILQWPLHGSIKAKSLCTRNGICIGYKSTKTQCLSIKSNCSYGWSEWSNWVCSIPYGKKQGKPLRTSYCKSNFNLINKRSESKVCKDTSSVSGIIEHNQTGLLTFEWKESDYRPSAIAVGSTALILMSLIAVMIFLTDLPVLIRDLGLCKRTKIDRYQN